MSESRRTILKALGATVGAGALVGTGSAKSTGQPTRKPASKPEMAWVPAHESNYSEADRESDAEIRWFVVHVAQGSYQGTIDWFQNPEANVSAHYVADHETGALTQQLDESDMGWHAGNWPYNQHSLGIEHSGFVNRTDYSDELYAASARIVRWAATEFDFPKRVRRYEIAPCDALAGDGGVIGHHQIPHPYDCSRPGGISGHTDPGSLWNWGRYEGFVRRWDLETGERAVVLADDAVRHGPDADAATADVSAGSTGAFTGNLQYRKGTQWYKLDFDGGPGWVPASETLYARFGPGSRVETTGNLSVRSDPGGERVGGVEPGTAGTVVAGPVDTEGYRWWKVEYDGSDAGWSAGYWLAG